MTGAWRWRRRYKRLIQRIGLPAASDGEALCRAVAAHLGRPIRLLPLPLPPDVPCGLVITTPDTHFISYDNTTSPVHQRHIIAHELGHLLAGHAARPMLDADVARLLMPSLDPRMVQAVLARGSGFSARAEREAEVIADLLWRCTRPWPADSAQAVDPAAQPLIERIRDSLAGE